MKISWSEEAVRQIRERFGSDAAHLRLVYDTEGCGCAVNGVPALWVVDERAPGDIAVDCEPFGVSIDPKHEVFFEDVLRIDYRSDVRCFRLSSDNQIYTSRLIPADRRGAAAASG
jgi:uncharacterized protein YqkB